MLTEEQQSLAADRVLQIIARRSKRNALLISDDDFDKQAVFDRVKQQLLVGTVPPRWQNYEIVSITEVELLHKAENIEELEHLIEASNPQDRLSIRKILFLHDIHQFLDVCAPNKLSGLLQLRGRGYGNFSYVGSTTLAKYQECIERHKNIAITVFSTIWLDKPEN
jgi:ATP-dependent Clp protease ATP-binding subunit ClpA